MFLFCKVNKIRVLNGGYCLSSFLALAFFCVLNIHFCLWQSNVVSRSSEPLLCNAFVCLVLITVIFCSGHPNAATISQVFTGMGRWIRVEKWLILNPSTSNAFFMIWKCGSASISENSWTNCCIQQYVLGNLNKNLASILGYNFIALASSMSIFV